MKNIAVIPKHALDSNAGQIYCGDEIRLSMIRELTEVDHTNFGRVCLTQLLALDSRMWVKGYCVHQDEILCTLFWIILLLLFSHFTFRLEESRIVRVWNCHDKISFQSVSYVIGELDTQH